MAPKRRNPTGIILNADDVRHFRKIKGFATQEELATAADVTTKVAWKAENNQPISLENADQIAIALGKKVIDLASYDAVKIEPPPGSTKKPRLKCLFGIDASDAEIEFFRANHNDQRIISGSSD